MYEYIHSQILGEMYFENLDFRKSFQKKIQKNAFRKNIYFKILLNNF